MIYFKRIKYESHLDEFKLQGRINNFLIQDMRPISLENFDDQNRSKN